MHFLSSSSRRVCACGRMSRPFGACISCGMTSKTRSPAETSFPVMLCASKSSGRRRMIARRMSSIPCRVFALTMRGDSPVLFFMAEAMDAASSRISALLSSKITGIFFSFNRCIHWSSLSISGWQSRRAMSVFSAAFRVRVIRISPSSPSSSYPGVSIKRQGPTPWISIALSTGSVVVPGVSETSATSCPVKALIREDLPLFRLPKRAIWRRLELGVIIIN